MAKVDPLLKNDVVEVALGLDGYTPAYTGYACDFYSSKMHIGNTYYLVSRSSYVRVCYLHLFKFLKYGEWKEYKLD